jgi:hypothetical protein
VTHGFHVLYLRAVAEELVVAAIAFKIWTPVTCCVHVLVGSMLSSELAVACFAFEFGIVVRVAHVLMTSCPRAESSVAGLALGPVTFFVHVPIAMPLVAEVLVTS